MIEYLLKRTDGDWFDITDMKAACQPISAPFEQVEGWGEARIRVGSCDVAFSYEDPGIQISFEGEIDSKLAEKVAGEVLDRIMQLSGQTGAALQISW